MGSRAYEQMEDGREDSIVARLLGLTSEELEQTGYDVRENASDDGLVYGHHIYISSETPAHIRSKIHGLGDADFVSVGPGELQEDEDDDAPE